MEKTNLKPYIENKLVYFEVRNDNGKVVIEKSYKSRATALKYCQTHCEVLSAKGLVRNYPDDFYISKY